MYLYGASGHAKVIIEILNANNIRINGLFDDNPNISELLGYKVFGELKQNDILDIPFIIAVGDNNLRKKIAQKYPLRFGKAFHPAAVLSLNCQIGEGSVVMANAVINSGARIGNHVIINTSSIVEHDCYLDDFVHVSPNVCLSGGVSVGEGSHIGSGAVVIPNISIGKWVTIGAGSAIIRDVPDNAIVVGNPGRFLRNNNYD